MNKQGMAFSLVGGLVAGFCGAWLQGRLVPSRPPSQTSASPEPLVAGDTADQWAAPSDQDVAEDQLARGRIASLERKVALLTQALARGKPELLGEDGAEPSAAGLDAVDVADPVFEAAVLDILDREDERREDERAERRREVAARRRDAFTSTLGTELGLSSEQKERLVPVIDAHFAEFRALRDDESPERPVTGRQFRERIAAINQKTDAALAEIFTGAQLEKYRELDPGDQIGFGPGRRRERSGAADAASRPAQDSEARQAAP